MIYSQVMLCFSRDSEILKNLSTQPGFMQVAIKGKQNATENNIVFPPSGVIPFHGFTMYGNISKTKLSKLVSIEFFKAAPFCYLFDDPIQLYFVFRMFYVRYFHRLHRVCANPQGVVSLCLQYEKMLQCFEPTLWNHFRKCQIHP